MSKAESLLVNLVTTLKDGSVRVCELKVINEHSAPFFDLCKTRDDHQSSHKIFSDAQRYLDNRTRQLHAYESERRLLENFVDVCKLFSSSEDLIQLTRKIRADVFNKEIRNLAPQDSSQSAVVSCFSEFSSYRQYIELTWKARNSCIFKHILNDVGRQVAQSRTNKQPPLTLAEIVDMICKPSAHQWQSICNEVVTGSMPLERVSVVFGSPETGTVILDQELDCISDFCGQQEDPEWKRQRRKQIEKYSKLRNAIVVAQTLKDVMCTLQFSRRFKEIDSICRQVSFLILSVINIVASAYLFIYRTRLSFESNQYEFLQMT